jgi:hypothetical protein
MRKMKELGRHDQISKCFQISKFGEDRGFQREDLKGMRSRDF